jgi:PhzF family phenazine biosynthesis protein
MTRDRWSSEDRVGQRIYQVDAFTDRPFAGNPAGVCILAEPREDSWMQALAAEMNLSETAFLVPVEGGFNLRWFSPGMEIDLCGHATLASAHVLWQTGVLPAGAQARFHTRSGLLTCDRRGDWIEMDFPATPPAEIATPPGLLDALGVGGAAYAGRTKFDYFVELTDAGLVRALAPDMRALKPFDVRGVIVTARSDDPDFDFISRFFAPQSGVDEDPVTGSAHCALAPYWAAKLRKPEMTAYQASERGGVVRVRPEGDRVILGGRAVTVFEAELRA